MVFAIGKGLYYKGVGRAVVHNCRFLFKRKELMSARNREKQPSQVLKSCFFSDSFYHKKLMSAIFNPLPFDTNQRNCKIKYGYKIRNLQYIRWAKIVAFCCLAWQCALFLALLLLLGFFLLPIILSSECCFNCIRSGLVVTSYLGAYSNDQLLLLAG